MKARELEARLGYRFENLRLLETALSHKYGEGVKLEALADEAENAARAVLLRRLTGKGKE